MNPENNTELWEALLAQFPLVEYLVYGIVASCGALTRYFWDSLRGVSKLSLVGFMTYLFLGFFVGNLVGSFMPDAFEYRDGLLLMAGFIVKELLEIIQQRGAGTISKFIRIGNQPVVKNDKQEEK